MFDQYKTIIRDEKLHAYITATKNAQVASSIFFERLEAYFRALSEEHPIIPLVRQLDDDHKTTAYITFGKRMRDDKQDKVADKAMAD